ncbi:type III secretion system export apparatus subunit SctV [Roseateles terrae]|uniref:Type III secretion protein V n=1 Tax=Roseateles terrae TaxID=431060 RepID=A0ABR6GNI2_9BURK|nr:type III secretion system export apparatus subunit SctV [Roseateles terrae]MBB3193670.1 type III secretion protein V [Roseateles terrae]OWQ89170.1 EscV/YscV/HrcV family type III secretion system export apparatus protein [Roseateles terrae]
MSNTLSDKSTLGNDLAMSLLVVAIVGLMILPLPTVAIDSLLAVNLAISVLLLMTSLFIPNAVALSSFPSLLLFTTLFRLSLNIASTKSILLHADAGHLIESFGELVVGGNLVVGIVVFIIITVVQFIVISKGSERVAEVGARFTLDAMPGKQMSIDADLRAGLLTGDEARRKRALLGMESQMHGGMDGAMKFVKGDAIAGLIITLVNILAGIVVGIMYHGMTAGEAANRFAVLSIGDAMVSQIPSLFICVAAGVLITRVADEHQKKPLSLGQEIVAQMTANVRAMYLAAGLVVAFAAVPGFPAVQFLMLGAGLAAAGRYLSRQRRSGEAQSLSAPIAALQREGAKGDAPSIMQEAPHFSRPLAVRMSPALAALLMPHQLDQAMERERVQLQSMLGVPFPGVCMWVDKALEALRFEVLINDVPVRHVELPGRLLLIPDALGAPPWASRAQSHGAVMEQAESRWMPGADIPEAERGKCLDIEQVMARQVMLLLRRNAHQFMGVQEIQWIVDKATADYPGLVAEVQKILPVQRIAEVMRRLLEEQVPIRNVRSIFESLITWGPKEKDMLLLTEYVRGDLGRYLAFEASAGKPYVSAILLDAGVEQAIRQCIKPTPTGNYLAMAPESAAAITEKVMQMAGAAPEPGVAVVTSMDIRRYVKKIIETRMDSLRVYSYQELGHQVELRPLGRVVM